MMMNKRIGLALKLCRVRCGNLTLDATAEAIADAYGARVNKSTISMWERGRSPITMKVLDAYARTFGTSIVAILTDAGLDKPMTSEAMA